MGFRFQPGDLLSAENLNKLVDSLEPEVKRNSHNIAQLFLQNYINGKDPNAWGFWGDAFVDSSKADPTSDVVFDTANRLIKNVSQSPQLTYENKNSIRYYDTGVFVTQDGTKLFTINNNTRLYKYTFGTPYDVSTLSFANSGTLPYGCYGVFMNSTGTKLITKRRNSSTIAQFTFSTPYDPSTINSTPDTTLTTNVFQYGYIAVSKDGTKVVCVDSTSGNVPIRQWTLSTPWDLSTATYDGESTLNMGTSRRVYGLSFTENRDYLYVTNDLGEIVAFRLSQPNNVLQNTMETVLADVGNDTGDNDSLLYSLCALTQKVYAHGYYQVMAQYAHVEGQYSTQNTYQSVKITNQQDYRSANLWVTRNITSSYNLGSANNGAIIIINGDVTGEFAQNDTVELRTADNTKRERFTITAIDYNTTNAGKTTITLSGTPTNTYGTADFIERVDVLPEISMVNTGLPENFQAMTWVKSVANNDGTIEDEYTHSVSNEAHDVVVKLNLTRNDTSKNVFAKLLAVSFMP